MGQGLVDVVEPNATRFVVDTNSLQTGDTSQERRSGQATEDQDLVVALQRPQAQRFPIGRETGNVRQRLSEPGRGCVESANHPLSRGLAPLARFAGFPRRPRTIVAPRILRQDTCRAQQASQQDHERLFHCPNSRSQIPFVCPHPTPSRDCRHRQHSPATVCSLASLHCLLSLGHARKRAVRSTR